MQSSEKLVITEISHEKLLHGLFMSQYIYLLIYLRKYYKNMTGVLFEYYNFRFFKYTDKNIVMCKTHRSHQISSTEKKIWGRIRIEMHGMCHIHSVHYARVKYLLHSYTETSKRRHEFISRVLYVARKFNIEFLRPRFSAQTLPPAFLRGKYSKFFKFKKI